MDNNIEKRPENTTILIPCFNIETIDLILYHGIPIAKVFDSSLTFLFMGDGFAFDLFKKELEKKSSTLNLQKKFRLIHFSSKFLPTPVIEKNNDNEEAIMVLFPQLPSGSFSFFRNMNFMLKTKKLRLPYMILQPGSNVGQWNPQKIIVPVGSSRSDKESGLWASYFARFGNSKISILYAKESKVVFEKYTRANVRFILTLFRKLGVKADTVYAKASSGKLHDEALNIAKESGNSLVLITSTRYYGVEHYITGPRELHTVKNRQKVPVLCINPRKDFYVLCT